MKRPRFMSVGRSSVVVVAITFAAILLPAAFITASEPAAEDKTERAGTDWWSLQPVNRPILPSESSSRWVRNPVDSFVLAKLKSKGLQPAPEASPRTLIRRLSFDLIGLPPEPERIQAFISQYGKDPDAAVGRLVDELLNSPHYGERWARHWLDIARYGESNGFEYDMPRDNAWPYRDWVINALNSNMPYDRFARLQIAGDILEPENPNAVIATGFLVCGAFDSLIPQGNKQRKIMREDEMEDLVGTVSQTFLGLTVHCARCHDHKFDPVSQKEYYQLSSALAGVRRGSRRLPPETDPTPRKRRIERLEANINKMEHQVRSMVHRERTGQPTVKPQPPAPIARWTFDVDLKDSIGTLHGEAKGSARIEDGALILNGKDAYVETVPLTIALAEKTLEVWVKLDTTDQRGGAAFTVQTLKGDKFDAIVFGENEPNHWQAGSDNLSRTKSFGGPEEKPGSNDFLHWVIVYQKDGTIAAYRNGLAYGESYRTNAPPKFEAKKARVLFGLRHGEKARPGAMLAGRIDQAQLYNRALTPEQIGAAAEQPWLSENEILARLTPAQRVLRTNWSNEIAKLSAEVKEMTSRTAYVVTPKKAPVTHLLVRGSPFQPGDSVAAGGVESVQGLPATFDLAPDAPGGERRKKLAEWIAHQDNPLLARVMVNRLWHYHFGQGLVKTPNDLGYSGGLPSHPDLLEWLAAEFRDGGWNLKAMHKVMVTSASYRQSSLDNPKARRSDASNVWLWRHTPVRLEAEVLRDAILKVSGQLNVAAGGPGFRDFRMHRHKGAMVYDVADPEGPEFNRRTIFRMWARGSQHPLLTTFDSPDPSATTPVRGVTSTPLGALSLMNASFVLRHSDGFAKRLQADAGDEVDQQIHRAYQLAFGRAAKPEELQLTSEFVKRNGLPAFCRVVFNATEFLYVN